jgi:hypothetical protein
MKEISIFQYGETSEPQRMTSLEIAELTGKQHKNVMQAIRNMEPAWVKVQGLKFQLLQKTYSLPNGGKKMMPYYSLTKTECLYIATKFNDEARARLVLRWEELERGVRGKMDEARLIPHPQTVLAMADRIIGSALSEMNAAAEDTLTATQVAKTFNMTVWDFNAVLSDMGIQYRRYGRWNLSDDLQGRGLTEMRTHISYSLKGERKVKHYMTWTLQGLRFLNAKLGYPNF